MSILTSRDESSFDIFLSYARDDDDPPFVEGLYRALTDEGFSVWWDRECMPNRGLTFLEEIRKAIHGVPRLVVVIGPNAVKSDYVRAEWQYALAVDKVVIPLLRKGNYDDLPPELKPLDTPAFTEECDLGKALKGLTRRLRQEIPSLGDVLGAVPSLPPKFQPRPDDSTLLAASVLLDRESPVTLRDAERVTVLHGIPGVGKSVLAAAFARATSTRRSFEGGVFWLTARPESEPLELLRQLGGLFGGGLANVDDLSRGVSDLRERLEKRRCLIVLDNVWAIKQVDPFLRMLGPDGRLLVTSRGSELVTEIGAREVRLDSLTEEAGLRHLAAWTATPVEELPPEAAQLAQMCGYLPFALALNGAMAADGVRWTDLHKALSELELDFAEKRFAGYHEFPTVLKSVQLSIDVLAQSDPDSADRYRELAVYLTGNGIPVKSLAILWRHRAGLKEHHTGKLVARLAGRGLLRVETRESEEYVALHDLQYDFLRISAESPKELNDSLLDAYLRCSPHDWPSGPKDGYFHIHLVEHLIIAGRPEEVHRLLSLETSDGQNAWYEAMEPTGTAASYLGDIERAWQLLEIERTDDLGRSLRRLEQLVQYTLMYSSIRSLSREVPLSLVEALVDAGSWTPSRAVAYARTIPDAGERLRAIYTLAQRWPAKQRDAIVRDTLTAVASEKDDELLAWFSERRAGEGAVVEGLGLARAIKGNQQRASALGALAVHLSAEEREGVVDEALQAAFETGEVFRPTALAAISGHLPEPMIDLVLSRVPNMQCPMFRDMILADLLPELIRCDRLEDAHARSWVIEDGPSRARALAALLGHLDSERRNEAVREILRIAAQVDEQAFADAVGAELERAGISGILATVMESAFTQASWRVSILKFAQPLLSVELRREVHEFVLTWPDSQLKVEALIDTARHTPRPSREELEMEATRVANRVVDENEPGSDTVSVLTALLEGMSAGEHRDRVAARAFDAVREAGLWVPEELALFLPEDSVGEALDLIRRNGGGVKREALDVLTPHLPPEMLGAALSIASSLDDGWQRADAMSGFASSLTPPLVRRCLAEIVRLCASDELGDPLGHLVPHLPAELLAEALELARQCGAAETIAGIAMRSSEPTRTELLREAISEALDASSDQTLEELTRHLPTALVVETVDSLAAEPLARVEHLAALLPCLPVSRKPELLNEVLDVASQHWPDREGSGRFLTEYGARSLLRKIAPELGPSHLDRGLELAERLKEPFHRAMTICGLLPHVPASVRPRLVAQVGSLVQEFEDGRLFDSESQTEQVAAELLPYLPVAHEALKLAEGLSSLYRSLAVEGFAREFPAELLDPALALARGIEDEHRAGALSAISVRLPLAQQPALWQEAFRAAITDNVSLYHTCRHPTAPSEATIEDVMLVVSALFAVRSQERWLAMRYVGAMAPILEIFGRDTAREAYSAIENVGRWWP